MLVFKHTINQGRMEHFRKLTFTCCKTCFLRLKRGDGRGRQEWEICRIRQIGFCFGFGAALYYIGVREGKWEWLVLDEKMKQKIKPAK